jgi:triosephosphate isomerase
VAGRRFVIGNWKMNGTRAEAAALASTIRADLGRAPQDVVVGVAPPFPFLETVGAAVGDSGIELCAQDCHQEPKGAFTGGVSVPMLASVGVKRVIVGHSERREHWQEDDATVRAKLEAVLAAGLSPVVCVGERLEERDAGRHERVVEVQLRAALEGLDPAAYARVIVAYEPVWAIGTGRTASPEQAGSMHKSIRQVLTRFGREAAAVPVIYGGSVKGSSIDGLARTPGIDGVLVGGASLEPASFLQIVRGMATAAPQGARS